MISTITHQLIAVKETASLIFGVFVSTFVIINSHQQQQKSRVGLLLFVKCGRVLI